MLLHGRTGTLCVFVEQQHTLWQLTVVQSLSLQHIGSHSLIVAFCHQSLDTFALVFHADSIQRLVEGKLLNVVEIFLLEIGGRHVIVGIHECKHILEHTTGGATGRYELHDTLTCSLIVLPGFHVLLTLALVGGYDAVTYCSCCFQFQEGEACFKLLQLCLDLLFRDTTLSNLFEVFF